MDEHKTVRTDFLLEEKIAIITINNPPVNVLTEQSRIELETVFDDLYDHPEVGAAVLTSTGERAFCAGIFVDDIEKYTPVDSWRMTRQVTSMFNTIYNLPVPVVAAINGPAVGAGFAIASLCDVVYASDNAHFSMNEINVGVLGGPKFLFRILPNTKVRKLFYTGERMSAEEAWRLGWVEKVLSRNDLLDEAKRLAIEMASKSPRAIRLAKLSLMHSELLGRQDAYEWECRWTAELTGDTDSAEAARAYIEKRKPNFKGIKHSIDI